MDARAFLGDLWSDIDPDGTWIFRTIEEAVGRKVWLHLLVKPWGQIAKRSEAEIGKSGMVDGPGAERPMVFAIRLCDRMFVDAGDAAAH
jgi:hypothetical protein